MTHKLLRLVAATAAVFLVTAADAQAQLTLSADGPSCFDGVFTPTFSTCWGAFDGNDEPPSDVVTYLASVGVADVSYVGKTEAGLSTGPFQTYAGTASGTLMFKETFFGSFILSLKAGPKFSLYLFDSQDSWDSIEFTTAGVSVNPTGVAQGLSHASLFRVGPVVTPEPGTLALLAIGLLGMAFVASRRRGDVLG